MKRIVHCKKEPYDVYIGRGNKGLKESPYHNPWIIDLDGTREDVIAAYKEYLPKQEHLIESILELDGKILGCWCNYPEEDCHGRIILETIEEIKSKKMSEEQQKPIEKIKLAVIGSRTCKDEGLVWDYLDKYRGKIKAIVSGGCFGPDEMAHTWAKKRGFPILIFYPKWYDENGVYDKGAGFRRNRSIIKGCDRVVAFWDGESRGTKNSMDLAEQLGKPLTVIKFEPLEQIDWSLNDEPKQVTEAKKEKRKRRTKAEMEQAAIAELVKTTLNEDLSQCAAIKADFDKTNQSKEQIEAINKFTEEVVTDYSKAPFDEQTTEL